MFSPSLFTKQQMELPFDHSTKSLTEIYHSTKSLTEILREAAASANRRRGPRPNCVPFWGLKSARFPESDFKNLGALHPMMIG
jgi:hypothetical protein